MTHSQKWIKALAAVLSFAMVFSFSVKEAYLAAEEDDAVSDTDTDSKTNTKGAAAKTNNLQQQYNDSKKKYDALQAEKKELDKKLKNAAGQIKENQANQEDVSAKIDALTDQITVNSRKITILEEMIAEKENSIAIQIQQIAQNEALFKQRLRAMYMSDNSSTLNLILGAQSFTDFLMRSEVATRITQHDTDLIETLDQQRRGLEQAKLELNNTKEETVAVKLDLEDQKREQDNELNKLSEAEQQIKKLQIQFQTDSAKVKKELDNARAQMDKLFKQLNESSTMSEYVGGEMMWPVPGFTTITSGYGGRSFDGYSDFHTGIDITGGKGKSIAGAQALASNAGTVSFVQYSNSGYGNYVIIDHGGGRATLYAHCASLLVSNGQKVQQGDPVALVGSTGNSTGYHLHFEVRINGKHTNPVPYLKG